MKFASLNNGRDGQLLLVSRDLRNAIKASDIAPHLQSVLDDWDSCAPRLQARYDALNRGELSAQAFAFDVAACASPLPRAYQWADGSAYVNHVELVRRARGAEIPDSFWHEPLIYQGGSDGFLAPQQDIVAAPEWGIDFEAEIAVVTDDVPLQTAAQNALSHVRLLMLVNDVSLRSLIPGELAKGFGFFQSKPASAFSPVAVTPDELGPHWRDGKLHLPLRSHYNGELFGCPNAGEDMTFDFGQLIAHVCKSRSMAAGSIVGSGTVSNKQGTDHGSAVAAGGLGYSCIAEIRMIETIRDGQASTGFMQHGDRIRIEMLDEQGRSIFGAIEQQVKALET